MAQRDLRRHQRIAYTGSIEVSWREGEGDPQFARGRCTDLSGEGLKIELPVSMPVRTLANLRFERIHLTGTATVRHSRRVGFKYIVGFELSQQLKQQVARNLELLQPLSPANPS